MLRAARVAVWLVAGSMAMGVQGFGQAAAPVGTASAPAPRSGEPDADGVYRVGGAVRPPVVVHGENPKYTKEARAAKINGDVQIGLTVDEQGMPQNVHVRRSLDAGLDEKAMEAVRAYRFKPATKDGVPVPVELLINVNFKIF